MTDMSRSSNEVPPESFPLFNEFNSLIEGRLSEKEAADLSLKIKSDSGVTLQYLMFMQVVGEVSFPHDSFHFHDVDHDTRKILNQLEEANWEPAHNKYSKLLVTGLCCSLFFVMIFLGVTINSVFTSSPVICHLKPIEPVKLEHVQTKLWGLLTFDAPDFVMGVSDGREFDHVELNQGILGITFKTGAIVNIQSPASFEFRSGQSLFVHSGKFIVDAEKGLRDVAIGTPQGWIKHIGTEFCVSVNEDYGSEIQVMEGSVVVSPTPEGTLQNEGVCLLEAKQAGQIKQKSEQVNKVKYYPAKFEGLLKTRSGVLKSSPNLKIIREPYQMSLSMGECESDNYLFMICEKKNVELSDEIAFTELKPSLWHQLEESVGFVSGSTSSGNSRRVDSYLLHRDLVGTPLVPRNSDNVSSPFDLEIECTFERPVVGFIENGQAMLLTDKLLGNPMCNYPNTKLDNMNVRDIGQKCSFSLSNDKHTLRMRLPVVVQDASPYKKQIDQIRVLVESEVQPAI